MCLSLSHISIRDVFALRLQYIQYVEWKLKIECSSIVDPQSITNYINWMRSGNSQILFLFQQIEELGKETQQNIEFFRNIFLGDRMGHAGLGGSVGCPSDWWSGGCAFDPHRVGNILSWRFYHELFLKSFSPFRWFKKGSKSVSGERMYTIPVICLED